MGRRAAREQTLWSAGPCVRYPVCAFQKAAGVQLAALSVLRERRPAARCLLGSLQLALSAPTSCPAAPPHCPRTLVPAG